MDTAMEETHRSCQVTNISEWIKKPKECGRSEQGGDSLLSSGRMNLALVVMPGARLAVQEKGRG